MKHFFSVIAILICTSSAFANTASVNGTSYSVSFHKASGYIQSSFFESYFTTYDGNRYSVPLFDFYDGYYTYSQELKKVGNLYAMDYFLIVDGVLNDYGEIYLNLPSTDANSNGVDDFCEKSLPFNSSVTGSWYSYEGTSGGVDGYITRNANFNRGAFSITANNTYAGNIPLSGNFYVGTVSGTLNYSPKEKTASFTYTSTFASQSPYQTFETTYEILDQNTIRVNANDLFPSTVFTRNGNTYSAVIEIVDGEPITSWPDYQKWLFQLKDTNDSDADGIPDLSDPPESKAMPWIPLLLLDD